MNTYFLTPFEAMSKFKFVSIWLEFTITVFQPKGTLETILPVELLSDLAHKVSVGGDTVGAGRLIKMVKWILDCDPQALEATLSRTPNIYIEGPSTAWEYKAKCLRVIRVLSSFDDLSTHLNGTATYMHEDSSLPHKPISAVRVFNFLDTRSAMVDEQVVVKSLENSPKILMEKTYWDDENLYETPESQMIPITSSPPSSSK